MPQLNFGAELNVAGQKTKQRRVRQCAHRLDHLPNARTRFGFASRQDVIQPEDVILEIEGEILFSRRDIVITEKLPHQAKVRASGEFQSFKVIACTELGFEYF